MVTPGRAFRLSLQTKVLLVVLTFLVMVPAITVWVVNRHVSKQVEDEARATLATGETAFLGAMDIRSRNLLLRYRGVVNEPRLVSTVQTGHPETIRKSLRELLDEAPAETEAVFVSNAEGRPVAGVRRDSSLSVEAFERACGPIAEMALRGESSTATVASEGRIYNVVAVPVFLPDGGELIGAITIGVRIGKSAVEEMTSLAGVEILLVTGGRVAASTLSIEAKDVALLGKLMSQPTAVEPLVLDEEHYLAMSDGDDQTQGFRYVLLSSYEGRLRALAKTRQTLVIFSLAGILLSGAVVWIFVSRITRPLRDLRDGAEAVGRGDFSRRIERFSNDECGDVAEAFNRMTANLESSRRELETTVDTLKATQAQLVHSEKLSAVGQFVAGVAHELNNPLTAVIGFADLLRESETDSRIRPELDMIARSAQRCKKIVQSLLSFSRQHTPERKLVRICGLIDDVLEIMAYDLRTSNVQVVREYDATLPPVMGDVHQLQQVLVNILGNARQALQGFRKDGRIAIRAFVEGAMLRIELQDNGPGIKPEHLSRIFDPFFTTKPVGKGTGLGMSLSYGIIQEHRGNIRVASEPGQGAVFIVELPLATAAEVATQAAKARGSTSPFNTASPAPGRPAVSGKTVLVVDDEEWILRLTEQLLRREGHAVEAVTSCEKALEALGRRKFDVIVSDWKMPGLNGVQFYEHLRVNDPESARRLLFMTGDVMSETFERFLRSSEKICLTKPFAIEDFRAAVAAIAERGDATSASA